MRSVSPVSLVFIFGAGVAVAGTEIARRLDRLTKASARHDRVASEWPASIARLNGRLYQLGTRVDRLEHEAAENSSRSPDHPRVTKPTLTASDLLAGMHSRYVPATLGGVTAVSHATSLCGVTLTTEAGDARFLLTSGELTKLVSIGADYLDRHRFAEIQSGGAPRDTAEVPRAGAGPSRGTISENRT